MGEPTGKGLERWKVGSEMAYEPSKFKGSSELGVRGDHENKSPLYLPWECSKIWQDLEFYRAWSEEFKAVLSRFHRPGDYS